jgi:hypothetical protein
MGHLSGAMSFSQNTRRWQRHQLDLPVRIVALNGILTTPVVARCSEISRAGMALHAAIALKTGDLMQLQFPTSTPSRVTAVVRNRTGNRLGLEFLTQLPPDNEAMDRSKALPGSVPRSSTESKPSARRSCTAQAIYAELRKKQQELRQLQREIEALNMAIPLLIDSPERLSGLPVPDGPAPDTRRWPVPSRLDT